MMMQIFLFLKQIVDMLYKFQFLDYMMVLLMLGLLGQCVWNALKSNANVQGNIKSYVGMEDVTVLILCLLFCFSFFRDMAGYQKFFKIISGFLLFFLGRMSNISIEKCGKTLALSSYIVVGINLAFCLFGCGFIDWAFGANTFVGVYYFKTDLAAGMTIAAIFIFFFSAQKILKYITIFAICPVLIFISNSRAFFFICCLILCFMVFYFIETKRGRPILFSWKVIAIICAVIAFSIVIMIFLSKSALFQENAWIGMQVNSAVDLLKPDQLNYRNVIWKGIMDFFWAQPIWNQIVGFDLYSEIQFNSASADAHSTYFRILYAIGYSGCIAFGTFVLMLIRRLFQLKDRVLYYTMMSLLVLYLLAGMTYITIDSTQYSWLTMFFAGVMVTQTRKQKLYR